MKFLILTLTIAVVNSRPQVPSGSRDGTAVQIEKQEVQELTLPQSKTLLVNEDEKKRVQSTKEILDKIVEINKRHGLTPKGLKGNQDYIQIPTIQRSGVAKQQNFEFPKSPFTNPIFDYLKRNEQDDNRERLPERPSTYPMLKTNAEVNQEDQIPGQYVKRKITHQQTFIIPSGNGMMGNYYNQIPNYQVSQIQNVPSQMQFLPSQIQSPQLPYMIGYGNLPEPVQNLPPGLSKSNLSEPNNIKHTLENQAVENIKNIVNKQIIPPVVNFNPYTYALPYTPYYGVSSNLQEFSDNGQLNGNSYRINGPNARLPGDVLFPRPSRQQWQWPLAQFFPIVIKDPFQQIYNAFTSMVEYGQSNGDALCADISKSEAVSSNNKISRSGKNLKNKVEEDEKTDQPITMDIENLEMSDNKSIPMKFTFSFKPDLDGERSEKSVKIPEPARVNHKLPQFVDFLSNKNKQNKDDKETVKISSEDNTGSGIFIQRLKVRKGGVAIAGPGGIATAGSGGTAIVGPHGYAYTQPDSVAIAGAGTKVIAVDPGVDLSEVIAHVNKNKTADNLRLGKVVAVGPVVYYNKG